MIEVARQAQEAFGEREIPLQVAVMGCVVNGPGEARDADLGIAAGNKKGHLFVRGQNVAVVPEDQMVGRWSSGPRSSMTTASTPRSSGRGPRGSSRPQAERDRAALAGAHGDDVNRSEQRVELIRKLDRGKGGSWHDRSGAARAGRGRVGLVLLAVLVVWFLVSAVLGFVFSLIRTPYLLFAIVAWFVLIGPPTATK